MNYVIQNTNRYNYNISYTPRLIFFFFFKNTNFFLLFILKKINDFFCVTKSINLLNFNFYKFFFSRFFFSDKLKKFISKINIEILNFHSNRLSKSYLFWLLYMTKFFLLEKKIFLFKNKTFFQVNNSFTTYLTYLPFYFINKTIFKYLFKKLTFFFLIIFSSVFINNNLFLTYKPNMLTFFQIYNLHIFFKGYFFNVYTL